MLYFVIVRSDTDESGEFGSYEPAPGSGEVGYEHRIIFWSSFE